MTKKAVGVTIKPESQDRPYNALIPKAKIVRFSGGPSVTESMVLHHLKTALMEFHKINDLKSEETHDFEFNMRALMRQIMARSVERTMQESEK